MYQSFLRPWSWTLQSSLRLIRSVFLPADHVRVCFCFSMPPPSRPQTWVYNEDDPFAAPPPPSSALSHFSIPPSSALSSYSQTVRSATPLDVSQASASAGSVSSYFDELSSTEEESKIEPPISAVCRKAEGSPRPILKLVSRVERPRISTDNPGSDSQSERGHIFPATPTQTRHSPFLSNTTEAHDGSLGKTGYLRKWASVGGLADCRMPLVARSDHGGNILNLGSDALRMVRGRTSSQIHQASRSLHLPAPTLPHATPGE